MSSYKTPGVYIEEISTLPPSVVEISTAVPAFIGHTQKKPTASTPQKINNMLEYVALYGGPPAKSYTLDMTASPITVTPPSPGAKDETKYILYYALKMYFSNGGGPCYIVPVGTYDNPSTDYDAGLDATDQLDEPTLLVIPDAVMVLDVNSFYTLCQKVLTKCSDLGDRFAILDVPGNYDYDGFRTGIGKDKYLMYGAAYAPYLNTGLTYENTDVKVSYNSGNGSFSYDLDNALKITYTGSSPAPKVEIVEDATVTTTQFTIDSGSNTLTITVKKKTTGAQVETAWKASKKAKNGFSVAAGTSSGDPVAATKGAQPLTQATGQVGSPTTEDLNKIQYTEPAVYNAAMTFLSQQPGIVLPPSAAMAGVYARVDRERGVWKAPANVSLTNVIGPAINITEAGQQEMNVHPSGKSINAIRSFAGQGTLVWGARTLAGNDNEWRYIPVRRLFITIEESIKKATAFAVFEPNDVSTWLKVKAMIESYLFGLWQQGALAGPSAKAAYFVNVGLGKTMTDDDINNGLMVVEVGIAAVRPAEFIILRFSQKMQEA